MPPLSCTLPRAALLLASALALSGCNNLSDWDREYACGGQEESSAWFTAEPVPQVARKLYATSIDLHLRADQVMVRSYLTPVIREGQTMRFSARSEAAWISGKFDRASGDLSLIEERTLEIMGRAQQIRTSGHYRCQPVTAAPRTT
ncbi:hypothetical protein [uncultured Sphaerotilus sp.]|uniref:hypothetical protein n=1 Tax=uncultured Sphaerotilus sp. TaxID=474984 RepID=UPI0030CA2C19